MGGKDDAAAVAALRVVAEPVVEVLRWEKHRIRVVSEAHPGGARLGDPGLSGMGRVVARDVAAAIGARDAFRFSSVVPASGRMSAALPGARAVIVVDAIGLSTMLREARPTVPAAFITWALAVLFPRILCGGDLDEVVEQFHPEAEVVAWAGAVLPYENGATFLEDTTPRRRIWGTRVQIIAATGASGSTVDRHLTYAFSEGGLLHNEHTSVLTEVRVEGDREVRREVILYDFEAISAVFDRVSTKRANAFKKWRSDVMEQRLVAMMEGADAAASQASELLEAEKAGLKGLVEVEWRRALDLASENLALQEKIDLALGDEVKQAATEIRERLGLRLDVRVRLTRTLVAALDLGTGDRIKRDVDRNTLRGALVETLGDQRRADATGRYLVASGEAARDGRGPRLPRRLYGSVTFERTGGDVFFALEAFGLAMPLLGLDPDDADKLPDGRLDDLLRAELGRGSTVVLFLGDLPAERAAAWLERTATYPAVGRLVVERRAVIGSQAAASEGDREAVAELSDAELVAACGWPEERDAREAAERARDTQPL